MDLTAFLAENAQTVEHVNYAASKRFLDSEGKPMLWELRAVDGAEDEALRKDSARRVPVPGRRGQYQRETDYDAYLGKLAVACTVFPNLNDANLQDSYRVKGAEALLKTMLTSGEYTDYLIKVQEVCGFEAMQDEVDLAKN